MNSLKNIIYNFWIKYKKLMLYIAIPLLAGGVGYLLAGDTNIYSKINVPNFAPPAILFPIVWSILYILMGISAYIISNKEDNSRALVIYYIQLAVNMLWNLFFFRLEWFLFSSLWIGLLILLVASMIYLFSRLNRRAALLQIPYMVWISFAFILNFSIYLLN